MSQPRGAARSFSKVDSRRYRRLVASFCFVAVIAGSLLFLSASPAVACSCGREPVAQHVARSDTVYIATPRAIDLFPGASFRILRVLKGPARSNIRVSVETWSPLRGGSSCATMLQRIEYVIVYHADAPVRLSLCNEYLAGEEAVREAVAALGPGRTVPRRPDPLWVAQWLILMMTVAGGVGLLILRRRSRTLR